MYPLNLRSSCKYELNSWILHPSLEIEVVPHFVTVPEAGLTVAESEQHNSVV